MNDQKFALQIFVILFDCRAFLGSPRDMSRGVVCATAITLLFTLYSFN